MRKTPYVITRHKTDLGSDMPLSIFAFGGDMNHLAAWVESRLLKLGDTDDDEPGNGLGKGGMTALYNLLSAPFELRPHLARGFADDENAIERLTREQYEVLQSLEEFRQVAISGGAGTGKTLLALQKASMLAENGIRTLLVCYNGPLGEFLRTKLEGCETVTVGSFHSVCSRLAKQAGVAVPKTKTSADLYDEILPQTFLEALVKEENLRFDAVIVDEGQDFRADWLAALRLSLRDGDKSIFYVFFDDNQKVYGDREELLPELQRQPYKLIRNLRNTRAIHRAFVPWYAGKVTRRRAARNC